MISITPRSFTNGLYFKGLRKYLLSEASIDLIHIFKRRDKVFNKSKSSSVLQENIICRFKKGVTTTRITIKTSECDGTLHNVERAVYKKSMIIDNLQNHNMIRIPESIADANILQKAEKLPDTFEGAGYFISTGRIVEHRTRQFIIPKLTNSKTIPLYRPHNVTPLIATWGNNNHKDVSFKLSNEHPKHTIKNGTYVLLKRFSSKDEKRRLVAGIHFANTHDYEYIGFGNKTNYIGVTDESLSTHEAFGLSAVFNSAFMDTYFRCISGNTQVNATEIRIMKFPSRKQIKTIGKKVMKLKKHDPIILEKIIASILGLGNDKDI